MADYVVTRQNFMADNRIRTQFLEGVKILKNTPSGKSTRDFDIPALNGVHSPVSRYDLFVIWHFRAMYRHLPPGNHERGVAHMSPLFLPWHRIMLLAFEYNLQVALGDAGFALPYWDWAADGSMADPKTSLLWSNQPDFLGTGRGGGLYYDPNLGSGQYSVTLYENPDRTATISIASPGVVTLNAHGLLANAPVMFTTTGALPTGLVTQTIYYVKNPTTNTFEVSATPGGASINTSGTQSGTHQVDSPPVLRQIPPRGVLRELGQQRQLPNTTAVNDAATAAGFDTPPYDHNSTGFRRNLEVNLHNDVHVWIGGDRGDMGPSSSPNDPVFFLHHCNVDRIWEAWMQRNNRTYQPTMSESSPDYVGLRIDDVLPVSPGNIQIRSTLDMTKIFQYDNFNNTGRKPARRIPW
jgi:tyrosinase